MISADVYVKAFIDGNWLSIAIFLFLLKAVANIFEISVIAKVYMVLAQAYQFIRPGTALNAKNGEQPK